MKQLSFQTARKPIGAHGNPTKKLENFNLFRLSMNGEWRTWWLLKNWPLSIGRLNRRDRRDNRISKMIFQQIHALSQLNLWGFLELLSEFSKFARYRDLLTPGSNFIWPFENVTHFYVVSFAFEGLTWPNNDWRNRPPTGTLQYNNELHNIVRTQKLVTCSPYTPHTEKQND